MIKKIFRNSIRSCTTYPGADIDSDHVPVICKMQVKIKRARKKAVKPTLLDFSKMHNEQLQEKYNVEVTNGFSLLERVVTEEVEVGIKACWDRFKNVLIAAAEVVLPERKRKKTNVG